MDHHNYQMVTLIMKHQQKENEVECNHHHKMTREALKSR